MISAAVRRRLEEILEGAQGKEVPWPEIPEQVVVFLEGLFPPRCLGFGETVEDHLRYAGVSALVQDLRWHHERQQGPETRDEQTEGELAVEVNLEDGA